VVAGVKVVGVAHPIPGVVVEGVRAPRLPTPMFAVAVEVRAHEPPVVGI